MQLAEQLAGAFQRLEPTARNHFSILFYGAIYALIDYLYRLHGETGDGLTECFHRYPFLARYLDEIVAMLPEGVPWQHGRPWYQAQVAGWEAAATVHLPVRTLATEAELPVSSQVALLLAGLGEEDSRFGTLFAYLQEPLPHRRPALELIGQIVLAGGYGRTGEDPWRVCRPLLELGLLQVSNSSAPRAEWQVQAPSLLWDVVRGEPDLPLIEWCCFHRPSSAPALDDLIFAEPFMQKVRQVPALLREGKARTLVIRGMPGSERLALLGAIARVQNRGLIVVENVAALSDEQRRLLGPLCCMLQTWPVLVFDPEPGASIKLPVLPGYRGPAGILLGLEGGLDANVLEETVSLTVPMPAADERRRIWQSAFGSHPVADLTTISNTFRLPGGYMRQVAPLAITQAALEDQPLVTPEHVRGACRMLNRQMLDSLAVRLEVEGCWEQLVVSDITAGRLYELKQRCRHRERLPEQLSSVFGSTSKQGVTALFTGVSGTGKTFAARILAADLQMDLYRVDLAAVVNKYIGETEKNLHQVLSHAEALDVILLLDEGDALLGSRTELKSSNDRYANLETNYLLQRLENYQGIVVITTNAAEYIDSAFQRRMDVVVPFVAPDAEARWQIWRLHLPANHGVSPALLEDVATRCALTGGQIRNAALHAILVALDDGGVVTDAHVQAAVQSEYRKAGATSPMRNQFRPSAPPDRNGTGGFLQAMADWRR